MLTEPLLNSVKGTKRVANRFGMFLIKKYGLKNEIHLPSTLPIPLGDNYLYNSVQTPKQEIETEYEDIWDTDNLDRLTNPQQIFYAKRC